MPESDAWRTVSSRAIYENKWIRVREDRFLHPSGTLGLYGVIDIRPSVGIVVLNEREEVALVGQFRYTSQRYTWEIPRGGSSPGETAMLAAAKRELREEVGVEAASWRELGAVDVCNGVTTDVQHLYLAQHLTWVGMSPDPEEELTVVWKPFAEAIRMVMENEITEVCSVAGILKAQAVREL